jgi:carboxymethylenebutenolidase
MITETIAVPVKSGVFDSYYARPDGDGPFPGIVVIHEIFGLNNNIRQTTDLFAGEGYAALAVDMMSRRNRAVCMARFIGALMLKPLNHRGIQDLEASLDWLAGRPEIDADRLGVIGFCMGGSFALSWACTDQRLKVTAPFYSQNPRPLEAVARSCPVVGSFPENDFTAKGGHKLKEMLDTHDVPNDIAIYPDSGHSFFNDQGGDRYNAEAAADAWRRTLDFFARHLSQA